MTLREWTETNPGRDMKGLRLSGPTGDPWTLAHAWRIGEAMPETDAFKIGLFLHEGDATEGTVTTVFTEWGSWLDTWTVRS